MRGQPRGKIVVRDRNAMSFSAEGGIDNVKSKVPVEKVAEIASGSQANWTMVPENTMKYAEFMHAVGTIELMPASWKDLFFPEVHNLSGS